MSDWLSMGAMSYRYTRSYQEFYDYDICRFRFRYRLNFDDAPDTTYAGTFQDHAGRRRLKRMCFQEHLQVGPHYE
jgi:hypothetical protein